jgi:hypothetical protein
MNNLLILKNNNLSLSQFIEIFMKLVVLNNKLAIN